jgi:hypothetical protein
VIGRRDVIEFIASKISKNLLLKLLIGLFATKSNNP